jgi:hypothetical protein
MLSLFARRLVLAAVVAVLALATLATPASADSGTNSCWGVVTSQRASTAHDNGEHASTFAGAPRLGLGNVARLFGFDSVGELGSFLATLDGDAATSCP